MKKQIIRNILKVFAVGGSALLMASAAGLLAYSSICLFLHIPSISGYRAVGSFITAVFALSGAIAIIYMCGCWIVGKGKFAR